MSDSLPHDSSDPWAMLSAARAEIEQLRDALEPGTGPAIVMAMFDEAHARGHHRFSSIHGLTFLLETLDKQAEQLRTMELPPEGPSVTDTRDLLTVNERLLLSDLAKVFNNFCRVTGSGPTRPGDLNEIAFHVHALQNHILAQAAARAYPQKYRLIGEHFEGEE